MLRRNEAEAEKDAADRASDHRGARSGLKRGDKALIGNLAYRRYLRTTSKKAFEIDLGKVTEEARYDGLFVLRTNARITPLQTVLRYRELLTVEALFRAAKASFDTRPIFHSSGCRPSAATCSVPSSPFFSRRSSWRAARRRGNGMGEPSARP